MLIDLYDLPMSEFGDYEVFFGNILGYSSMITIMRKDKGSIINGEPLTTAFVAFIDLPIGIESIRFAWHDNVKGLDELPFSPDWALEEFKKHREEALKR